MATVGLFDLTSDAEELHNVYGDPAYVQIIADSKERLHQLKEQYNDLED